MPVWGQWFSILPVVRPWQLKARRKRFRNRSNNISTPMYSRHPNDIPARRYCLSNVKVGIRQAYFLKKINNTIIIYLNLYIRKEYSPSLQTAMKLASLFSVRSKLTSTPHCWPPGQMMFSQGSKHLHLLHWVSSTNALMPYGQRIVLHSSMYCWQGCSAADASVTASAKKLGDTLNFCHSQKC